MIDHIEDTLRALAEKATPGPWRSEQTSQDNGIIRHGAPRIFGSGEGHDYVALITLGTSRDENASFISAANPLTVSRLAAVVTAARALYGDRFLDGSQDWTDIERALGAALRALDEQGDAG